MAFWERSKDLITNEELLKRVKKIRKKLEDLELIVTIEDLQSEINSQDRDCKVAEMDRDERRCDYC